MTGKAEKAKAIRNDINKTERNSGLLKAENNVLVTTKPRFECVKKICNKFIEFKDLIQFRFTVTSINCSLLEFWEPGAPTLEERLKSLKYAYENGFKTSISIEPFLDENPYNLVKILKPYTTESIWIGKMNHINKKIISNEEKYYYELLMSLNSKQNLKNRGQKIKIGYLLSGKHRSN